MKKIGIIICMLFLVSSGGFAQEGIVEGKRKKEKVEVQGKKVEVKVKHGEARPMIIIDGKEYDNDILDMIDPDKIESITVIKGEEALTEYNAKNGVIIIESKAKKNKTEIRVEAKDASSSIKIRGKSSLDMENPVVVIDGVIKDKEAFDKLLPQDIKSVTVLKDEKAKKKYNTQAGAILIETKKKKQ